MVNGDDKPSKPPPRHPWRAALVSLPSPKPHCVLDVLRRVEGGATTKDDADYLLEILNRAGERIGALEMQVVQLQRRLATVH